MSALCRNHILYGESAGIAIRDENLQQRVDDIERKLDVMGSLLSEINHRAIENTQNFSSLSDLFKKSFSVLATGVKEVIKVKS